MRNESDSPMILTEFYCEYRGSNCSPPRSIHLHGRKKRYLIAILAAATIAAQAAFTEFYVQTTGSNLNAGSTADDAAELTGTGGNWVAATGVYTFSGATDLSGVAVGEWASVYADGATVTGFAGYITAVNDGADTITVSLVSKSGTAPTDGTGNRSIKVGGAWDGPSGTATAFPFSFVQASMTNAASSSTCRVNFKCGTDYTWEAETVHANVGPVIFEGYTTTVGDGGTAGGFAIFDGSAVASGTPFNMFTVSGSGNYFRYLWWRDNFAPPQSLAASGNYLVNVTGTSCMFYRCKFTGAYRSCLKQAGGGSQYKECQFSDGQYEDSNAFGNVEADEESEFIRCSFTGSGRNVRAGQTGDDSVGVDLGNATGENVTFDTCVFADNWGDGMRSSGAGGNAFVRRSIFVRNGVGSGQGSGISMAGTSLTSQTPWDIENNIFEGNDDYGISNDATATGYPFVSTNAFYNNGTGQTLNINSSFVTGSITLTGSPFVDSANGDWRVNSTAGAGAAVRAVAAGTLLIDSAAYSSQGSTVGYSDLGPVQHQDSGGGTVTRGYPILQ